MSSDFFHALTRLLDSHPRLAMATVVSAVGSTPRETAARMLVLPDGTTHGTIGGGKFESLVVEDAKNLLARGALPFTRDYSFAPEGENSFGAVCGGKATVMLEIVERAPRLLVIGAGHCGRALARVAVPSGYEVTVLDERAEQLDPGAFPPGTRLLKVADDYSDLPLPAPDDFVAIMTRGHATDGLALRRLRGAPVAYLGMMGSRAKQKALFDDLRREGWHDEEFARINSPIGLDIGAESPEEIAIAIVAELVQRRRGRGRTHGLPK